MLVTPEWTSDNHNNFIVIEGLSGVGKGTFLRNLEIKLKEHALPYLYTRQPGGSSLGAQLRELILNRTNHIDGLTELFLFAADRSHHVQQIIRPALAEGKIVVSDRYYYSTEAFQGWGRGVPLTTIRPIMQTAIDGLEPSLVILLDLDPKIALERAAKRTGSERDAFEEEELTFHKRVREGYLDLAQNSKVPFLVIDADRRPEAVFTLAWSTLLKAIGRSE